MKVLIIYFNFQAQSINDVTGIGLHETRRALELSMDNLALLKQSDVLAKTVDWMVSTIDILNPYLVKKATAF